MSLIKTKEQLIKLLGQSDNNVIALSGKWGTGKTHLWNEVKDISSLDSVKKALYVSLFGLSSIDEVKRKLIESAIPGVDSHGGLFDGIKNVFKTGINSLSEHYKVLAALKDLNILLMAPAVLREKVIVIDDIERKNVTLNIDEILGFIDDYSKQYKARFLLLLNDDQLSNQSGQDKLWATFREKVIDQEIRLSTSSEEAFSIAITLAPSNYSDKIKRACVACGLTNIRIIVKIIRAANQILAGNVLRESVQARVIPSIVLFSAIYYRGLDDGPDFNFVLNAGNMDWSIWARDKTKEPTIEEKREDGWNLLLQELGIHSCGEFEQRLVEFLESGLFEAGTINSIIERFKGEVEALEVRQNATKFLNRFAWDYRVDDGQLLAEAASFTTSACHLDPFIVTQLESVISTLPGGAPIGMQIVDAWIDAFKANHSGPVNDENPFNNPLHRKINDLFEEMNVVVQANVNVFKACMSIIENNGWGAVQEHAMRRATAADFEATIREIEDIDQFRRFMRRMMEMRLQRETYDSHFGSATERFVEACRNIANDESCPRLASIIKGVFEGTALAPELAKQ